jgi:type IV pilus assembly protein PilV
MKRQDGIALLEALLATLILAIGLLGAIGLQARAYSALSDAGARAEATIATEKLLGLMANDQSNLAAFALTAGGTPGARLAAWYSETRAVIPGASVTVTLTPAVGTTRTQVDIAIGWTRKAGGPVNTHRVTAYMAPAT